MTQTTADRATAGRSSLVRVPPGFRHHPTVALVSTCLAIATVSLLIPTALGFDPAAWLVWGREIAALDLDTTAGPSWKPLPVVLTTPISLVGAAAPEVWTVVGRAAGLLLVAGVFTLARRLGGTGAAIVSIVPLVLTPDGEPRLIRTIMEAHSAPLDGALTVWAVERHLAGRHGVAVALLVALSLSRPEAWPFLLGAGLWMAWASPRRRLAVLGAWLVVPVLWFGGDWWGSGDPLSGAGSAQVDDDEGLVERFVEAAQTVGSMVVIPVWVLAGAAVLLAWHARGREATTDADGENDDRAASLSSTMAVAGLAAAWCAVVIGMASLLGYAALSRFTLPAVTLVCALAGTGAVGAWSAIVSGRWRRPIVGVVAALVAAVSTPQLVDRVTGLADVRREIRARALLSEDLPDVIAAAGGRDAVLGCGGPVAVQGVTLLLPTVAWELDLPLSAMRTTHEPGPAVLLVIAGGEQEAEILAAEDTIRTLARSTVWAVHALDCPRDEPAPLPTSDEETSSP